MCVDFKKARRIWQALAVWWASALVCCGAHNVTLAWLPSSSAQAVGYHVYYGTASGVYTSKVDAGTNVLFLRYILRRKWNRQHVHPRNIVHHARNPHAVKNLFQWHPGDACSISGRSFTPIHCPRVIESDFLDEPMGDPNRDHQWMGGIRRAVYK